MDSSMYREMKVKMHTNIYRAQDSSISKRKTNRTQVDTKLLRYRKIEIILNKILKANPLLLKFKKEKVGANKRPLIRADIETLTNNIKRWILQGLNLRLTLAELHSLGIRGPTYFPKCLK